MDLAPFRRRYGAFPVERRDWPVDAESFGEFAAEGPDARGAAVLIWNRRGQILLLRHAPGTWWGDDWATPGGIARPGESPEDCARRETSEETHVEVRLAALTKVIVYDVAHDDRRLAYTFFQFEGDVAGGEPRPGEGIAEVAWHDALPEGMHFRADYVQAWRKRRSGA